MLRDPELQARLGALLTRRTMPGGAPTPAPDPLPPPRSRRRAPAAPFPGHELHTAEGALFVHEQRWTAADPGHDQILARLSEARERLELLPAGGLTADLLAFQRYALTSILCLDLETGGLSGHPVFLAGFLTLAPGELRLRQLLARNYLEEPALIAEARRMLAGHPVVVTYNGKSFDLPMLADRAVRHGLTWHPPAHHVDLLHPARRAFRHSAPNCRLITLEWAVCRRWRARGVESRDIPGIFHRFARDGDPTELAPVLHHNAHDLLTLAELAAHLVPHPPGPRLVLEPEGVPF